MEPAKEGFPCGLVLCIRLAKELPLCAMVLDQYGMVLMQGLESDTFAQPAPIAREINDLAITAV